MHTFWKPSREKALTRQSQRSSWYHHYVKGMFPKKFKRLHYYHNASPFLYFKVIKKSANYSLKLERGSNSMMEWEGMWRHPNVDRRAFCFPDTANVTALLTASIGPQRETTWRLTELFTVFYEILQMHSLSSVLQPLENSLPVTVIGILQKGILDLITQYKDKSGGRKWYEQRHSIPWFQASIFR